MSTETPCAKCPWRAKFKGEADYLRPGRRAEIMRSMLEGGSFPCHETTDMDQEGDEYVRTGDEVECVGADLVHLRADSMPQMLRIREQLGMLDAGVLLSRNKKVKLWTLREALDECRADPDDESRDVCHVVGMGCEAPAGYLIGGEVVHGEEMTDNVCSMCGEFVCESCMDTEDHECSQYPEFDAGSSAPPVRTPQVTRRPLGKA